MQSNLSQEEGFYIVTDYQSEGRGQVGTHWESEREQNLLVSFLLHPQIAVSTQFRLAMLTGLAVAEALDKWCKGQGAQCTIKWPNDIYFGDKKVGGILIENKSEQGLVKDSIIGIGVNVNQLTFVSDAPNPISLRHITGKQEDKEQVLQAILQRLRALRPLLEDAREQELRQRYIARLYRRSGLYEYEDAKGRFKAEWVGIGTAGEWIVRTEDNEIRTYLLKQIKFIL